MAEHVGKGSRIRGPGRRLLRRFWEDEGGQDLVEYVLIVSLVVIVVIATLELLGGEIGDRYSKTRDSVVAS